MKASKDPHVLADRELRTCPNCFFARPRAGESYACNLDPPQTVVEQLAIDGSMRFVGTDNRPSVYEGETCRWWTDGPRSAWGT